MDITALQVYRIGGNFYSILVKDNGGPFVLGKQMVDEVPADADDFQAWKRLKVQHFLEADIRPLTLPPPSNVNSGSNSNSTEDRFPSTRWVYIIDLQQDTFQVSLPRYWSRAFSLQNLPRSLFESAGSLSTGAYSIEDEYRVFVDPVARSHLPPSARPTEPNPAHITEYESHSTQLLPSCSFPGMDKFPVRKHLRLILLQLFYRMHCSRFVYANSSRDATSVRFLSELVFTIINLARSTVEFRLQRDAGDRIPAESQLDRSVPQYLYDGLPETPEYWIDDVLVVLEPDISTAENLHAAIGKALLLTSARTSRPTTPSAIICSLSAIVLVYICGTAVSHTANLNFFPQYLCRIDDTIDSVGVLALLDTFYHPAQPAAPQSFPGPFHQHLPTEICQAIFHHASPATRTALGSSCRLFRGISYDHGVRIGQCYFQMRSPEKSDPAFVGEIYTTESNVLYGADKGVWGKRAARAMYTRRTMVYLAVHRRAVGSVYWPVLVMPDGHVVRLDLRSLEAKERPATAPGMPWWSQARVR